eukprot:1257990-Rhodomonas_salina.2
MTLTSSRFRKGRTTCSYNVIAHSQPVPDRVPAQKAVGYPGYPGYPGTRGGPCKYPALKQIGLKSVRAKTAEILLRGVLTPSNGRALPHALLVAANGWSTEVHVYPVLTPGTRASRVPHEIVRYCGREVRGGFPGGKGEPKTDGTGH